MKRRQEHLDSMASTSNVSDDLIWLATRHTSSYIVKGQGISFSKDPLNVSNVNRAKYSGLANCNAIGVQAGKTKGVVVFTKKNGKLSSVVLKPYSSVRRVNNIVAKSAENVRADISNEAIKRANAIKASQLLKKAPRPSSRSSKKSAVVAEAAEKSADSEDVDVTVD